MQPLKSVFGVIGAIVPIIYCGSLLYHFGGFTGSGPDAMMGGPSMVLGLGVVSLLFCIPLILKLMRLLAVRRSSASGGGDAAGDDESGFDADAAVARYLASKRSAESVPSQPAAPAYSAPRPAPSGGAPARRPGFGRRIG